MIDPNAAFANGWPFSASFPVSDHTLLVMLWGLAPVLFVVFLFGIVIGLILPRR